MLLHVTLEHKASELNDKERSRASQSSLIFLVVFLFFFHLRIPFGVWEKKKMKTRITSGL